MWIKLTYRKRLFSWRLLHAFNILLKNVAPPLWFLAPPAETSWRRPCARSVRRVTSDWKLQCKVSKIKKNDNMFAAEAGECILLRNVSTSLSRRPSNATRPVTSLGHQVRRKVFWEGPKFLNYVQYYETISNTFFQWRRNFAGRRRPPAPSLVTGLQLLAIAKAAVLSGICLAFFT